MTNNNQILLGIVGTGLMGKGIAQIAAQGGIKVMLYDSRPQVVDQAKKDIAGILDQLATKGKITPAQVASAVNNLTAVDSLKSFKPCSIVIEAIVENIDAKRSLFQELESIVSDDCILATNTSSLSVTSIAAGCRKPARVAGFHFFSPVPLMKVVEVIAGVLTSLQVTEALIAAAHQMGHTPIRAKDTPGFLVNHAGRAYLTESLRILGESIAPHAVLDDILREGVGFRMGPFELLDLTGLDISHPAMESIYERFYHEARLRPSFITSQRLAAGLLGRKTGQGFYVYENGKKEPQPPRVIPELKIPVSIWLSQKNPIANQKVSQYLTRQDIAISTDERPDRAALCLVMPVGQDATTSALSEDLDPTHTVAIDPLFFDTHRTIMTTPLTLPAMRDAAHALMARDGAPASVIHDSPGFVCQRVVACIVNVACDIAQQSIASPEDIDRAITLALGYPKGPLAMGDALGANTILKILDELFAFYRDPRYRPSPWLIRRAMLGVSLLTSETPNH